MSKTIAIILPHDLGIAEAKRRVDSQIERLRAQYVDKIAHSTVDWTDDQAKVFVAALGQSATGLISVFADSIRIEVELPWMLAALSGKIEGLLQSTASESLRLTHSK
jgi:hypothetical protein